MTKCFAVVSLGFVERRLGGRFNTLWLAATTSFLGDGVALAAFPLLAAHLTNSPVLIAGTQIARGLPFLLVGVLGGVAHADRYGSGAASWSAWTCCRRGNRRDPRDHGRDGQRALPVVWLVIFVLTCGETLFDPAAAGLVPNIVPTAQLERANGRLIASESTAKELLGPALGALLFTWAVWVPLQIDSLSFVIAAALVAAMSGKFHAQRVRTDERVPHNRAREHEPEDGTFCATTPCCAAWPGSLNANFGAAAVEATLVLLFALHVLHTGDAGSGCCSRPSPRSAAHWPRSSPTA